MTLDGGRSAAGCEADFEGVFVRSPSLEDCSGVGVLLVYRKDKILSGEEAGEGTPSEWPSLEKELLVECTDISLSDDDVKETPLSAQVEVAPLLS